MPLVVREICPEPEHDPKPDPSMRVILVEDIIRQMDRGVPINYEGCIIRGDLVLYVAPGEPEITKQVNKIKIINSVFEGCFHLWNIKTIHDIDFSGNHFNEKVTFQECIFNSVRFNGSVFDKTVSMFSSTFNIYCIFIKCHLKDVFTTQDCSFKMTASFKEACFKKLAAITNSNFFNVDFENSKFNDIANFMDTRFRDANFNRVNFNKNFSFNGCQFDGEEISFKDLVLNDPRSGELIFRKAKNTSEKLGNRVDSGYYFYREMKSIREQNSLFYQSLQDKIHRPNQSIKLENLEIIKHFLWYDGFEYIFVQKIFGYGVHPWWLMGWWIVLIGLFAFIYSLGDVLIKDPSWINYLKYSLGIALAPGYIITTINSVNPGVYHLDLKYQAIAIVETILGTFMWAGFIATFAKKYMK